MEISTAERWKKNFFLKYVSKKFFMNYEVILFFFYFFFAIDKILNKNAKHLISLKQ